MAEQKTKPTKQSVKEFLESVSDSQKRKDSFTILDMMKKITKLEPVMWGPSMVGFGSYHYKYASGHEGDTFLIGFSPRKSSLVLYMHPAIRYFPDLVKNLGKIKLSGSCLHIKKIEDIDITGLKNLVTKCYQHMKDNYAKKK